MTSRFRTSPRADATTFHREGKLAYKALFIQLQFDLHTKGKVDTSGNV